MEQAEALAEYKKLVKANPEAKADARRSFYDTFKVDPESSKFEKPKMTEFQRTAARRKADIGVEQTKANYEQDISNAKAKFVGDVSKVIPVAATLATGGMAAIPAMGVMGASGATAGGWEEAAALALGADTAVASPKQLARRLGVDAAVNAGAQAAVS